MRDPAHLARLSCRRHVHDCLSFYLATVSTCTERVSSCQLGVDCVHTGSHAKYSHGNGHVEISVGQSVQFLKVVTTLPTVSIFLFNTD